MSRKVGTILFNVVLAVGGATVYAWVLRGDGSNEEAWKRALIEGGSAGLLAGLSVGCGASLGSRPVLGWRRCVIAQAGMALSSIAGAAVSWMFPREWSELEETVVEQLAKQGLLLGSGIGLLVGTVIQVVQVYLRRRRPSR